MTKHLRSSSQLAQWKSIVQEGGTASSKYEMIREWTYDRFIDARSVKQQVSTRMLRQWALQAANQFLSDSFHFTAGHTWLACFKNKYRIRHRKVTRFVSKKDTVVRGCHEIGGTFPATNAKDHQLF